MKIYTNHPKITQNHHQNYQTKVTFGLHVGIAIEGSIGSQMKIDALNISSDLLIAFRIEELNEKYGTEILLTGDV